MAQRGEKPNRFQSQSRTVLGEPPLVYEIDVIESTGKCPFRAVSIPDISHCDEAVFHWISDENHHKEICQFDLVATVSLPNWMTPVEVRQWLQERHQVFDQHVSEGWYRQQDKLNDYFNGTAWEEAKSV